MTALTLILSSALIGSTTSAYVTDAAASTGAIDVNWQAPSVAVPSTPHSAVPGRTSDEVLITRSSKVWSVSLAARTMHEVGAPEKSASAQHDWGVSTIVPSGQRDSWLVTTWNGYYEGIFILKHSDAGFQWETLGGGSSNHMQLTHLSGMRGSGQQLTLNGNIVRIQGVTERLQLPVRPRADAGANSTWVLATTREHRHDLFTTGGEPVTVLEVVASSVAHGPENVIYVAEIRDGSPFLSTVEHGVWNPEHAVSLPAQPSSMAFSEHSGTLFLTTADERVIEVDPADGTILTNAPRHPSTTFTSPHAWPHSPVFTTHNALRWIPLP
ncbi:hypothetical protein ACL9RL_13095 [Plantibacter sp. Mn2098]|uniref:hypothetical protein n=1 Tax=Plantibacter sp. Mn2098 TaxID=3395266 RepID=UPI003BDF134E